MRRRFLAPLTAALVAGTILLPAAAAHADVADAPGTQTNNSSQSGGLLDLAGLGSLLGGLGQTVNGLTQGLGLGGILGGGQAPSPR